MAHDDWRDDWGPRSGHGAWPPFPDEFPPLPDPGLGDVSNEWREHAACKGEPHEVFFAPGPKTHLAQLCDGCPVQEVCLMFVMATEDYTNRSGYFAGTTPAGRAGRRTTRESAKERYIELVGAHRWG